MDLWQLRATEVVQLLKEGKVRRSVFDILHALPLARPCRGLCPNDAGTPRCV